MSEGTRRLMLEVNDDFCQLCEPCSANEVCKAKAFRVIDKGEAPFLDMSRCWGCLICIPACNYGAVAEHSYK